MMKMESPDGTKMAMVGRLSARMPLLVLALILTLMGVEAARLTAASQTTGRVTSGGGRVVSIERHDEYRSLLAHCGRSRTAVGP